MNHETEPPRYSVKLTPKQEELCRKFEDLHQWAGLTRQTQQATPTEMFKGALYLHQRGRGDSPDWIAQAAHSLREMLYPFRSRSGGQKVVPKCKFKFYQRLMKKSPVASRMRNLWSRLNVFAHHYRRKQLPKNIEQEFEGLFAEFQLVTHQISSASTEMYEILDPILSGGPNGLPLSSGEEQHALEIQQTWAGHKILLRIEKEEEEGADEPLVTSHTDLRLLLEVIPGMRSDFFKRADGRWLKWARKNEFFGTKRQEGMFWSGERSYWDETAYLYRMVSEAPGKVADIICGITVGDGDFTGGVIEKLIWISSHLPASELTRITQKIRDANWVSILAKYGFREFQHHRIVNQVDGAGLLALAQAMLTLYPKENLGRGPSPDRNPFCISNLSYGKLFHRLAEIDADHVEQALSLVLRTLGGLVDRVSRKSEGTAFELFDDYFLPDVDFFTVELEDRKLAYQTIDGRNLAATLQKLATQYVANLPPGREGLVEFHKKNIGILPDSWATWRMRLFFWELAPDIFKDELRDAMFRIFKHPEVGEIVTGAEYRHVLKKEFGGLPRSDRQEFWEALCRIARLGQPPVLVDRIFTMIYRHLAPDELETARKLGIKVLEDSTPRPLLGQVTGEPRFPKGPISQDKIGGFPVPSIVEQLKAEWSPDALEKSGDGTSQSPDAMGMGLMLGQDIRKRPNEYARCANRFFDQKKMDPHYTYTYLEEMRRVIKDTPATQSKLDGAAIVACCHEIVKSDRDTAFDTSPRVDSDGFTSWLQSWPDVLFAVSGIVREMLYGADGPWLRDIRAHRDTILEIVSYLLSVPDPRLEGASKLSDQQSTQVSDDGLSRDPFGLAMNTTKGIALDALVLFAIQEVKHIETEGKGKLADDLRDLLEDTLAKTTTEAIMSVYGWRFLSLRALDVDWGMDLLGRIFPRESKKQNLFEAAWIGYLRSTPSMSTESDSRIHDLYHRGIRLLAERSSEKESAENLSEGLVRHLARFFVWCPEFGLDHAIHKFFWAEASAEVRGKFVRIVGDVAFEDGSHHGDKTNSKLYQFWDAILNASPPKGVLEEFGYWINTKSKVIEIASLTRLVQRTLKITKGCLSWPFGLEVAIEDLAENAPEDAFEIAHHHLLLWSAEQSDPFLPPVHPGSHWYKAIKILLKNRDLKAKTTRLVKELVAVNNQKFEPLRHVLAECDEEPGEEK